AVAAARGARAARGAAFAAGPRRRAHSARRQHEPPPGREVHPGAHARALLGQRVGRCALAPDLAPDAPLPHAEAPAGGWRLTSAARRRMGISPGPGWFALAASGRRLRGVSWSDGAVEARF